MSNGIGKNPLIDISKVYLQQIANEGTMDIKGFEIPKKEQEAAAKRVKDKTAAKQKNIRGNVTADQKARLEKKRGMKLDDHPQYKKEEYVTELSKKTLGSYVKKASQDAADRNFDHGESEKRQYDPDAADEKETKKLANRQKGIGRAVNRLTKEGLDPVGKEDGDVNNDGKKDSTDSYLMKRRKAIGNAMKKKMKEQREFAEESLTEVMTDEMDDKPIKEKKVKNKITINPKLGEAVEELGGTLIEEIEVDELDVIVETVYEELIGEGFSEDEVEYGIETALNTLDEGYYDSAVASSKAAAA